ncbi:MAG TPA: sirohydrochlorin cobaltochelatase [Victivallales bacterium]|nr:sirohydrochlorin cobaltochelatase [Victivallales bacterium]
MVKNYSLSFPAKLISIITAITTIGFCAEGSQIPDNKIAKKGILLVAFGTSVKSGKKSFENIDRLTKEKFKNIPIRWAYTSSFIRKKLAKQGEITYSVREALNKMKTDGFTHVAVQSLHITNGSEFNDMVFETKHFTEGNNAFQSLVIGEPLLISYKDLEKFINAVLTSMPNHRETNDAIVLMGHGNRHGIGDMTFTAARDELKKRDSNSFLATVEGYPDFNTMKKNLIASKIKKAYLIPMMIVCGDHAYNDMAGSDSDSWKSQLEQLNIQCIPVYKGLGENNKIVNIFLDHIQTAMTPWNKEG